MTELRLPIFANLGWILAIFVGSLIIFHLMLVWPRNLTKRGWKVIDYFWLTAAFFGVIGSVGASRQAVAQGLLTTAHALVESSAAEVESALRFGKSGAVCRRFVRSEFSPPPAEFNRIQREFDSQCAWFTQAFEKLNTSPISRRQPLSLEDLGGPPPKGGDDWASTHFQETVQRYDAGIAQLERLLEDTRRTDLEMTLTVAGPSLLVIALALRIAKVSGEIRHEIT